MTKVLLIARRELGAYLRSPLGYVIAAIVLLVDGLLFNAFALGPDRRLSGEVLRDFFYFSSGTTMIAALLLSMRLLAEERQSGTFVLLRTSPLSEWAVVLGKYLSALIFLGLITLATLYLPLLILVNGKIGWGHLAVGYLGLLLLGSASLGVGILASALAPNQVLAAVSGAAILVALLVSWLLARVSDPPLDAVFASFALYNKHFVPFMGGLLHLRDVVYYLSVTFFGLLLAVRIEAARRWS
ncbi:MAG: ABC transporter permease [Myxococcota bacterium]|jgi:ABC-2 type transport system permease protein|nr:ABC transporter permease [Myxococcota bacterium]